MSWADYVNHLLAGGACNTAAILSGADATIWAASPGFTISKYDAEVPTDDGEGTRKVPVDEAKLLVEAFNNRGIITSSPAGLRVSGKKWKAVRYDPELNMLYLKIEKGGACAVKTNQTIVFGTYDGEGGVGACNKVVEGLATLLKGSGF
eukprot:TRINITY_DN0_c614_g1_i7.p1 TRINITY_DN0_c614_g1~~TRINITY_DN0_c614_g1_i7.p1  ORF type:complete len:149 (+),score=34.57 TRINITY_DN0_c614_g1_i7:55-501(+)